MQLESDAPVCIICGEPATRSFGSSGAIPLCSLSSCEQALINEINLNVQPLDDQEGELSSLA